MIRSSPWNGCRREIDDVVPVDLDDVVTGPRVSPEPQRRNRAGVDDEQVLEPPGVRHVLVAGEDEMDAGALQALDRVAGVVDDVPLATRARHGQQVVVEHEDPQVGRLARELAPRSTGSGRGRSGRGRGRARSSRRRRPSRRPCAARSFARRTAPRSGRTRRCVRRGSPGRRRSASQSIRSRYWRASWYSCLKPKVVRSPEQTTMSGWSSLTSEIARSSRFGSKYGPPQCRSERWAMRNGRCGGRPSRGVYGGAQRGRKQAVRGPRYPRVVPESPRETTALPGISRLRAAAFRQRRGARMRTDPRLVRDPVGVRAALVRARA